MGFQKLVFPIILFFNLFYAVIGFAQTANFTSNVQSGCAPMLVQFTSTSTGTNASTTYQWSFGNTVTSVLQNPSTTYSNPGTYTVTLTVSNGPGSTNTKTITNYITVLPAPQVSYTTNINATCPGSAIQFTNTSVNGVAGAATYLWNFGDGNSDNVPNPLHTFTLPGTYNITFQVTNNAGCSKTKLDTNRILIYTPPSGTFSANATQFCNAPQTINFTSAITGSGPFTYAWNFGDNTTGLGATTSHTYTSNGVYTVKLEVTDVNGCKDTIINPNFINLSSPQAQFSAPTSACRLAPVTFTNTTNTAITGFVWLFGDGDTAMQYSPTHTYLNAGTYTVRLVAINGACTDTVSHTITINPKPVANFTVATTGTCPAPQTISFVNTSSNASSYVWSFGDGTQSTLQTPSHLYTSDSFYTVKLIASNSFGCYDSVSITDAVKIFPLRLEALPNKLDGCIPLPISFQGYLLTRNPPSQPAWNGTYPYGIASYSWSFGNNNFSTAANPTYTYTTVGVYWVKLTAVTFNGCTVVDSFQVAAGSPPTANFTYTPSTVCLRDSVHFVNTSTNANAYYWFFGDSGSSGDVSPYYHYNYPGVFTVKLMAINNGCKDSMIKTNIITALGPKSIPNFTYDCVNPLLVHFADSSILSTSHTWFFGDGQSSTANHPNHTYASMGTYQVMLVAQNSTTGCIDTNRTVVTLLASNPNFIATDTTLCKKQVITLSAIDTQNIVQYNWTNNWGSFQDTTFSIVDSFPYVGAYTITLITVDKHNCRDTITKTNFIKVAWPNVNFGASPLVGCTPMTVIFSDSTTDTQGVQLTTRKWLWGDATQSTLLTPVANHTYINPGLFTIKLIVSDTFGCKDSLTKNNYIDARHPQPLFFADDTTACIGQVINFTNLTIASTGTSYQWYFGDGTSSTTYNPSHIYTATGTYTIKLIATDPIGCKDSFIRVNNISITKPQASFTLSDSIAICPPLLVQFTNTSLNAISYAWSFGNSNTSISPNPTNPYNSPGLYTIRLIATNSNGCTDTAFKQVKVLGYAGAFSYATTSGCAPLTVSFTANISNIPSLIWDFSDGVTQNSNGLLTVTHTYLTPGAYVPKILLSDGLGCVTSSTGLDTIKVNAVFPGFKTNPFPICEKAAITFIDTTRSLYSTINAWSWTTSTLLQSTIAQPIFSFPSAGIYTVKLIASDVMGCKDSIIKQIKVEALPNINAGKDTVICLGDAVQLKAMGGVSYMWNTAATLSCLNCAMPIATPTSATKYVVFGTDQNGCVNKDTVQITLKTRSDFFVRPDTAVCKGHSANLLAYGANSYIWSPSATLNNALIPNPIATPTATQIYKVLGYEGACLPDTQFVKVTVLPRPIVNAGNNQQIVAGDLMYLYGSGNNVIRYQWLPSAGIACDTCPYTSVYPKQSGTYMLVGTNSFGCTDTSTMQVSVLCQAEQVFIPNSFTPNGDGHNDVFYPRGKGLSIITSFKVFDRWGELLFERKNIQTDDPSVGWDGEFRGVVLSPDVYVYIMEAICETGEPINWKGDIMIMR